MLRLALVLVLVGCGSKDVARDNEQPVEPTKAAVIVPVPAAPPFEIPAPTDKLVSIGRGERHACVVRESGAVDCWGQHTVCKDCVVPPVADSTIRRIPGITDAQSISGDGRCVLRKTGEVACLSPDKLALVPVAGLTGVTALGAGSTCFVHGGHVSCVDHDKLHVVPNVRDAVTVSSVAVFACAVRKTGEVMCGETRASERWTRVVGIPRVKELVVAGLDSARICYVSVDGAAGCFNSRYWSLDGEPLKPLGSNDSDGTSLSEPERFKGASQLAIGGFARIENSTLTFEAVVGGHVVINDMRGVTSEVPLLTDAVQHVHGCAIRAQGSLVCWGTNDGGALAQPTTINVLQAPPAPVAGSGDVVDLALGTHVGYALTRTGQILRWGKSTAYYGERGVTHAEPMPLGLGPHDIVEITADLGGRLCMRSKTDEVWCHLEHAPTIDRMIDQLDTENVASISSSWGRLYAVHRDGTAEWHETLVGADVSRSKAVPLAKPVIGSSGLSSDERCWMVRDHTLECAKPVAGIDHATALATSAAFSCAIQRGSVLCWAYGADKNGVRQQGNALIEIPGIVDATDLAASLEYACAVHSGGKVSCFHFGEDDKVLPKVDVIDGGAVDVELTYGRASQIDESQHTLDGPQAAGETGCSIMRDYTVQCWGTNLDGETGDGSLVESTSPIGVRL